MSVSLLRLLKNQDCSTRLPQRGSSRLFLKFVVCSVFVCLLVLSWYIRLRPPRLRPPICFCNGQRWWRKGSSKQRSRGRNPTGSPSGDLHYNCSVDGVPRDQPTWKYSCRVRGHLLLIQGPSFGECLGSLLREGPPRLRRGPSPLRPVALSRQWGSPLRTGIFFLKQSGLFVVSCLICLLFRFSRWMLSINRSMQEGFYNFYYRDGDNVPSAHRGKRTNVSLDLATVYC